MTRLRLFGTAAVAMLALGGFLGCGDALQSDAEMNREMILRVAEMREGNNCDGYKGMENMSDLRSTAREVVAAVAVAPEQKATTLDGTATTLKEYATTIYGTACPQAREALYAEVKRFCGTAVNGCPADEIAAKSGQATRLLTQEDAP